MSKAGGVEEASLDNDLGEGIPEGRKLVLWMAEHDTWPSRAIRVHSANPVSVEYMEGVIERYGPFERVGRTQRFVRSDRDSRVIRPRAHSGRGNG